MSTHTYVVIGISAAAYEEVKGSLTKAGYQHAFGPILNGAETLDMSGIGLFPHYGPSVSAGTLEISNVQGEVVVNHPDLKPDENGVGHIIFSPEQARNFGTLLFRHAAEAEVGSNK